MNDEQAIEQRVSACSPELPAHLREHVLRAVHDELTDTSRSLNINWIMGMAATLLIGMNLALYVGHSPQAHRTARVNIEQTMQRVGAIMPELDDHELWRLALKLSVAETITPLPLAPTHNAPSKRQ